MTLSAITSRRELALRVWWAQLNQPYIWGGDDPVVGFDCSGLVLEGLKSAGLVPRQLDTTADGLLNQVFKTRPRLTTPADVHEGCLVFWKNAAGGVRHVEIVVAVLGTEIITIGASGGGSRTPDAQTAAAQNAYVKVRPAAAGWLCAIDPFSGA